MRWRGLALAALSAILGVASAQDLGEVPAGLLEAKPDPRPKVAIVIDDVGLDWVRFQSANRLPIPITLAFLPYGKDAQAMLDSADPRHCLLLHMPMEPKRRKHDAGPGMVARGTAQSVRKATLANLEKLNGFSGVSNHTGSALTENRPAMNAVLSTLKASGYFFLDSKTSPRSVASSVGARTGAVVVEASLFLDGDFGSGGQVHVDRQLTKLMAIAERDGVAIGIGHPYPATLSAVSAWSVAHAETLRFVTIDELAAEKRAARRTDEAS
ncbi:MAG: divergent polysaccharide deacetylase family protein [Pseudomonadota bacterium]